MRGWRDRQRPAATGSAVALTGRAVSRVERARNAMRARLQHPRERSARGAADQSARAPGRFAATLPRRRYGRPRIVFRARSTKTAARPVTAAALGGAGVHGRVETPGCTAACKRRTGPPPRQRTAPVPPNRAQRRQPRPVQTSLRRPAGAALQQKREAPRAAKPSAAPAAPTPPKQNRAPPGGRPPSQNRAPPGGAKRQAPSAKHQTPSADPGRDPCPDPYGPQLSRARSTPRSSRRAAPP